MFTEEKKKNFLDKPTVLPETAEAAGEWQQENKSWWERNAMRYDWGRAVNYPEFSPEFFKEIDKRFFSKVYEFMPWEEIPFDHLIDFRSLKEKDVLEIGVGLGSTAQLLARHARSFTGIDLTEYAVRGTRLRLKNAGLSGDIERMDAEEMSFADNTFDFIWSWGVIHHSSNTPRVISEIARVLRPGGKAVFMVYHRGWWNYYLIGFLFFGLLEGGFSKYGNLHKVMQSHTDGAIARYYKKEDWKKLFPVDFETENIFVCGPKTDIFPIPSGKLKNLLMTIVPDQVARFFTNTLNCGSFLVSVFKKNAINP